jgi:hypothetical protein
MTGGTIVKTCSLNDFMEEIKPWLDKDHIRGANLDDKGHFVLHFRDGMKNVYHIDDCNEAQIKKVLNDLKNKGIPVTE